MKISRALLAIFFILAGINHFVAPQIYLAIVPAYLPWPAGLIALSGLAEILGGIGVLPVQTRRWAGWGLIALLSAVFPANVYAISVGMEIAGHALPTWALWARLPLQIVLIFWVYRSCLRNGNRSRG